MEITEIEVGYFLSFAGEAVKVIKVDRKQEYVYTDKRIAAYSINALRPFLVSGNMKNILLFANREGNYSDGLITYLFELLREETPIALHLIQKRFNAECQIFKIDKENLIL